MDFIYQVMLRAHNIVVMQCANLVLEMKKIVALVVIIQEFYMVQNVFFHAIFMSIMISLKDYVKVVIILVLVALGLLFFCYY